VDRRIADRYATIKWGGTEFHPSNKGSEVERRGTKGHAEAFAERYWATGVNSEEKLSSCKLL